MEPLETFDYTCPHCNGYVSKVKFTDDFSVCPYCGKPTGISFVEKPKEKTKATGPKKASLQISSNFTTTKKNVSKSADKEKKRIFIARKQSDNKNNENSNNYESNNGNRDNVETPYEILDENKDSNNSDLAQSQNEDEKNTVDEVENKNEMPATVEVELDPLYTDSNLIYEPAPVLTSGVSSTKEPSANNALKTKCFYGQLDTTKDTKIGLTKFNLTKQDVMDDFYRSISNIPFVQPGIFDNLKIKKVIQLYMPMFMFNGTYKTVWTAKVDGDERGSTVKMVGSLKGDYSFPLMANEDTDVTNRMILEHHELFAKAVNPSTVITLEEFQKQYEEDSTPESELEYCVIEIDFERLWRRYGAKYLKKMVEHKAKKSFNHFYYSFSCNTVPTLNTPVPIVYVPMWNIVYTTSYDNKEYYYVMSDADKKSTVTAPIDRERAQEAEILVVQKQNIESQYLFWLCCAIGAVMIFAVIIWYFLQPYGRAVNLSNFSLIIGILIFTIIGFMVACGIIAKIIAKYRNESDAIFHDDEQMRKLKYNAWVDKHKTPKY